MVSTVKFFKGELARVVTDTVLNGRIVEIADVALTLPSGLPRQKAKYVARIHEFDATFSFHEWELEEV